MTHTATPWQTMERLHRDDPHEIIGGIDGEYFTDRAGPVTSYDSVCEAFDAEDAAFIVKAVNAHDELVEALKTLTGIANKGERPSAVEYRAAMAILAKVQS